MLTATMERRRFLFGTENVALIAFLVVVASAMGATLRSMTTIDMPGPSGKRFDYLTIDYDDHYLLLAHLAAGLLYVVDLRTNQGTEGDPRCSRS